MMSVKEIVKTYLESNGFDGLYSSGECGCIISDLMPCGTESALDCLAGYKSPAPEDCEWAGHFMVGPKKDGIQTENLFCGSCHGRKASVQTIRITSEGESIFAVVCPSCEASGYHASYSLRNRSKEESDALAIKKAVTFWNELNKED
jgi:hypothetical protein